MMVIPPRTRPRTARPAPVTAGFGLAELAGDEFRRRVRNEAEAGECRVAPYDDKPKVQLCADKKRKRVRICG